MFEMMKVLDSFENWSFNIKGYNYYIIFCIRFVCVSFVKNMNSMIHRMRLGVEKTKTQNNNGRNRMKNEQANVSVAFVSESMLHILLLFYADNLYL